MDLATANETLRHAIWIVVLGGLLVSLGIAGVLHHQWTRFSADRGLMLLTLTVYGAGCFVILAMLFVGAYTFFI
jgi:hypothetical protein